MHTRASTCAFAGTVVCVLLPPKLKPRCHNKAAAAAAAAAVVAAGAAGEIRLSCLWRRDDILLTFDTERLIYGERI